MNTIYTIRCWCLPYCPNSVLINTQLHNIVWYIQYLYEYVLLYIGSAAYRELAAFSYSLFPVCSYLFELLLHFALCTVSHSRKCCLLPGWTSSSVKAGNIIYRILPSAVRTMDRRGLLLCQIVVIIMVWLHDTMLYHHFVSISSAVILQSFYLLRLSSISGWFSNSVYSYHTLFLWPSQST